jgi:hypothetical protein
MVALAYLDGAILPHRQAEEPGGAADPKTFALSTALHQRGVFVERRHQREITANCRRDQLNGE